MPENTIQPAVPDTGKLQIEVTSTLGLVPVVNAVIKLAYTGDPDAVIEEVTTDSSGQSPVSYCLHRPWNTALNPFPHSPIQNIR